MVDNRKLPQATFTRTLSDSSAGMVKPARADVIDDGGAATLLSAAAKGLQTGLSVAGDIKSGNETQAKSNINQELIDLKKDIDTGVAISREGLVGVEQGTTSRLKAMTQEAIGIDQLSQKYGGAYLPEIHKAAKQVFGYHPETALHQLETTLETEGRARARKLDDQTVKLGIDGVIPVHKNVDGTYDIERMREKELEFLQIQSEVKRGVNTDKARNYLSELSASVFTRSGDMLSQLPQGTPDYQFFSVIDSLNKGGTVSEGDKLKALRYLELNSERQVIAFEGSLGKSMLPEVRQKFRKQLEEQYVTPIKNMLELGSSQAFAESVAKQDAATLSQNPSIRSLKAIKEAGLDPFVTEMIMSKTAGAAKGAAKAVENLIADIEQVDIEKDKAEAGVNLPTHVDIIATMDKASMGDKEYQMYARSAARLLRPASNNIDDIATVANTITSPKDLEKLMEVSKFNPETKQLLNNALALNTTELDKYIKNSADKFKDSNIEIKQDPKNGVIFATRPTQKFPEGSKALTEPFQNLALGADAFGNDLDKFLTALNSFNSLQGVKAKLSGEARVSASKVFKFIGSDTLVNTEGGASRSGNTMYMLPKNNIHANMLNKEYVDNFWTPDEFKSKAGPIGEEVSELPEVDLPEFGEASSDVESLIEGVVDREGGFVDDPVDRGGATKFGITQKTLQSARGGKVSKEDVKGLTKAEAGDIYREEFYIKPKIDQLPDSIKEQVFDFAVNSGPGNAIKAIQKLAGVKADGVIGPQTIKAVEEVRPSDILTARLEFFARIVERDPKQAKFLRGWNKRAIEVAGL